MQIRILNYSFKEFKAFIELSISRIKERSLKFLKNRIISRHKYILDLKKYFSNNLDEISFTVSTPSYKLEFNNSEKQFLKENITCPKNLSNLSRQREIFSCYLKNVKFLGHSGGVMYKNLPILDSGFNIHRFNKVRMVDSILLKHRKMDGLYTSIMHYFIRNNYYHFLIDNLPRLFAISKLKESEIYFIIPQNISPSYLKVIKLMLDDRFKIIQIKDNEVWELENYFFSSFCSGDCSGYMPKFFLDFIKEKLIAGYGIKPLNKNLRIYLSRNKAKIRRLINEDRFYELLKKYDFKRIFAEDLSHKEQIRVFNSASIIISPFGAGLSNMIFSNESKILELFPPKMIRAHFFMLSKALNYDYYYLIGEAQRENQDFRIDLSKADKIIKEMIKK